jgi:hypothetical protein
MSSGCRERCSRSSQVVGHSSVDAHLRCSLLLKNYSALGSPAHSSACLCRVEAKDSPFAAPTVAKQQCCLSSLIVGERGTKSDIAFGIVNRTKTKASKAPVPMCEALAAMLQQWRQETPYSTDEDFVFASPALSGKLPMWGQSMNADFVKPAAIALQLVAEGERFGWHCFRHSLSTWANEATKDITVSQTMLRHAKPDTTGIYTHGNFSKALDAQREYMQELLAMKPASEAAQ